MPTLAEIRQSYPQYRDLSDAQLADGPYRKFYPDMPREAFDAKIGFGADRAASPAPTGEDVPEYDAMGNVTGYSAPAMSDPSMPTASRWGTL